jgi:uncharacterized protein YggU (UPF0235/DUF167 family)
MLNIHERDGALVVAVRVQPRASRDEVVGEMDGALKVRLQAPAVEILSGDRSRVKRIEIRGVTKLQVLGLLTREV